MYRILTVCTGNICRSPMAELMLERAFTEAGIGDQVAVDSAGTTGWELGQPIDRRAAAKLDSLGISSTRHRARQFEPDWYADRDLILALDADHYTELRDDAPDPESRAKVRMLREFDPETEGTPTSELGIYDPWFGDESDFERTWELVDGAVGGVIDFVRAAINTGK